MLAGHTLTGQAEVVSVAAALSEFRLAKRRCIGGTNHVRRAYWFRWI